MARTTGRTVSWVLAGFVCVTAAAQPVVLDPPAADLFHQDVAWSPDGRTIAFSRIDTGRPFAASNWSVFTISADGGEPSLVAAGAKGPDFSPDGKRLVLSRSNGKRWELWIVTNDGRPVRQVTRGSFADLAPSWSPDGSLIAFQSDRSGTSHIYVAGAGDETIRQLTFGPRGDSSPAWSPDGSKIIFYRSLGDRQDQVFEVSFPAGRVSRVTNEDGQAIFPSFRSDGRVTFTSRPPDGQPFPVRVADDGTDRVEIRSLDAFFVRYSPDMSRIAFIHGRWPRSAVYVSDSGLTAFTKIVN